MGTKIGFLASAFSASLHWIGTFSVKVEALLFEVIL